MSSDHNLAASHSNEQKDSNSAENKETSPNNGKLMCEICNVSISSKKNLEVHNSGRKHQLKVQRRNKNSLNSAGQVTEKIDINDNHSSNAPSDFLCSNPPEKNGFMSNRNENHGNDHEESNANQSISNSLEVSDSKKRYSDEKEVSHRKKSFSRNYEESDSKKKYSSDFDVSDKRKSYSSDHKVSDRKKEYSKDYEASDRKKNYSKDCEESDRKKARENDYDVSDRKKTCDNDYDVSDRKKTRDNEYKNNYSKSILPSKNYYSPNRREHYYNNQNYGNRNNHWNRWSTDQSFRDDQGRFQSFSGYNRYNQNYHFNRYQKGNGPPPVFNNWEDMSNPGSNEIFSESVQSENIQPVEGNTNFETNSDTKQFDEVKTSNDDQKSPIRKLIKVVDKNKRSPRIPIKSITKTIANTEDVQNQAGSETQQKDVVLSENMTGKRLAHWINPSNQKDQAEIRRLVTEFSKSRKKENLLKLKLHTDKVAVISNLRAIDTDSLPMTPEGENSAQPSFETIANVSSNSMPGSSLPTNKRQRSTSFTDMTPNATSPVARLPSARNRSESLSEENSKKPQRHYTKRKTSTPSDSPASRKRKDSVELGSASKKHKCSSAECLEKCIESAILDAEALINPERTKSVETVPVAMNTASENSSSRKEEVYVKKEIFDEMDASGMTTLSLNELIQKQTDVIANCQDDASLTPVESLINLFATGNITIKKEFDDPLIDAIRSIDPALLSKVCEDEPDKKGSTEETIEKVIEPVIVPPPAILDNSLAPLSSTPSLTLSLKNIINELQLISEEEEKVKGNLQKADKQIQYYQSLLDNWKTKKIKFQSEEEILRNKRNTLVKTMNDLVAQQSLESKDLVAQQSLESKSTTESSSSQERPPSTPLQRTNVINNTLDSIKKEIDSNESDTTIINFSSSLQNETAKEIPVSLDSEDDVIPIENDEIVVLPLPESRIPVIDLDQIGSPNKSNGTNVFSKKSSNTESISANCHKFRDLVAHNAVINSLQIFDDYLYTCANDKTAKRINIKDPTKVVTYSHAEKNIIHLCVERMRGKTYVFTSASNSNFITVFDAESALKVKVHQFRTNISNMCKGKSKIYVGLKTGLIHTCDWKEQKELVHNEEPIRSIATAHQGGINILVTLSSKGNVSVRDADRNGLLIKYVKALAHVPLFMSIYHDWVYLSSAGYLSVLDLSTGTFVKKYELPAAYTSLTVHKDHIFTTSFSGFVRCYSKYDIQDVRAYYGAGKMALTCIHVHDDWVFTGNRTGEVSVFKFDSENSLPCQFGKCSMVFARMDDLMYHVLQGKDHNLVSLKTCLWRECNAPLKRNWDQEAIHNHIRAHVTASCPSLHQPIYNLTA